ncbi:notch homolog 2 N-terminal-like protein A isoform X2 [Pan troglodytes]|uniref:notch homolog 2 N-terminal-like protein A isoform X2 n=1 Tax=Pan troglodytes TaxID=9598 RepID=UPI0023F57445|nr:notch homolog 2 N-terminal-like protein A isoform X2 [Pan troglodytes]
MSASPHPQPCEDTASVATRSHLGSREQALPDTESASTLILVQPSEVCPEGLLGEYCQHRDPYEKNRCQNGGTCVAQAMLGKATCRCASGFTGEDCQYSTSHPCFVSRPCLNGGTCHMLSRDTYECTCQVGFTGKECQWTDACLSHPCANGSTCTTVANQFSCKCLTGFTGQKCETDVNECDIPGHCQDGGTCLNLPGSYQCQCPQGFTGQYCDSLYVPCAPSPCVNGGTCRQTGDFTFECSCLPETVRNKRNRALGKRQASLEWKRT